MGNYCLIQPSCTSNSVLTVCTKATQPIQISYSKPPYLSSDKHLLSIASNEISFTPADSSFEHLLLSEINLIRTSPHTYADKIKAYIPFILKTKEYTYLHYEKKQKIIMSEHSKDIFESTVNILHSMKPMKPLIWNNSLKIKLPSLVSTVTNNLMERLMINKRNEYREQYKKIMFTIDIFADPVLSALFQVTDEMFKGDRRQAILNEEFSQFAVTYKEKEKGQFFSIATFA